MLKQADGSSDLSKLWLTTRTKRSLEKAGIKTRAHIQGMSDDEILDLEGMGKVGLSELRSWFPYPEQEQEEAEPEFDDHLDRRIWLCERLLERLKLRQARRWSDERAVGRPEKSTLPLTEIGLSYRALKSLNLEGFFRLSDFDHYNPNRVSNLKGVGNKGVALIKQALVRSE